MKQHLAVSVIGSDRTGMVHELTRVISECGGNISESRMASLGSEFAMLMLVSGNWHALAKLETEFGVHMSTTKLCRYFQKLEFVEAINGDSDTQLHVRDLAIPGDVTLLTDGDEIIAKVQAPRVEEVVEVAAEAGEGAPEGEEAAEGAAAEGETPAPDSDEG